ncbi:unnamed protein product, partial [Dicrocoelium dendriticum]
MLRHAGEYGTQIINGIIVRANNTRSRWASFAGLSAITIAGKWDACMEIKDLKGCFGRSSSLLWSFESGMAERRNIDLRHYNPKAAYH